MIGRREGLELFWWVYVVNLVLCVEMYRMDWVLDFFFFQAEDGIRDYKVTGVQTCALPIFPVIHQRWRERIDDVRQSYITFAYLGQRMRFGKGRRRQESRRMAVTRHEARTQIGRASCRERV